MNLWIVYLDYMEKGNDTIYSTLVYTHATSERAAISRAKYKVRGSFRVIRFTNASACEIKESTEKEVLK